MRWYLSVAAVKQYQAIAGYPQQSDGPHFDRAERELADICDAAELARDDGPLGEKWRAKAMVHGRLQRLELTVITTPRPEGPLAQLVRVRLRDRGGGR